MKKVYWLNAMINIIWIVSVISIPVLIFALIGVWWIDFNNDNFRIRINGNFIYLVDMASKFYFCLNILVYLMFIYIVYLFKRMVNYFLRALVFDEKVIFILNKIGYLLLSNGIIMIFLSFLYTVYHTKKVELELGISGNVIMIFLGVFFMVLGEIFKLSKNIKLENDLTI